MGAMIDHLGERREPWARGVRGNLSGAQRRDTDQLKAVAAGSAM